MHKVVALNCVCGVFMSVLNLGVCARYVLDYLFQTKNHTEVLQIQVLFNYVSLTFLSLSCCWAGIRMLAADWLSL